jgi:hypothetical protein
LENLKKDFEVLERMSLEALMRQELQLMESEVNCKNSEYKSKFWKNCSITLGCGTA